MPRTIWNLTTWRLLFVSLVCFTLVGLSQHDSYLFKSTDTDDLHQFHGDEDIAKESREVNNFDSFTTPRAPDLTFDFGDVSNQALCTGECVFRNTSELCGVTRSHDVMQECSGAFLPSIPADYLVNRGGLDGLTIRMIKLLLVMMGIHSGWNGFQKGRELWKVMLRCCKCFEKGSQWDMFEEDCCCWRLALSRRMLTGKKSIALEINWLII
jgi:hypothetical protein